MDKKKHDPFKYYLKETLFSLKDTRRRKVSGWKMMLHSHRNEQKRDAVAILTSDK